MIEEEKIRPIRGGGGGAEVNAEEEKAYIEGITRAHGVQVLEQMIDDDGEIVEVLAEKVGCNEVQIIANLGRAGWDDVRIAKAVIAHEQFTGDDNQEITKYFYKAGIDDERVVGLLEDLLDEDMNIVGCLEVVVGDKDRVVGVLHSASWDCDRTVAALDDFAWDDEDVARTAGKWGWKSVVKAMVNYEWKDSRIVGLYLDITKLLTPPASEFGSVFEHLSKDCGKLYEVLVESDAEDSNIAFIFSQNFSIESYMPILEKYWEDGLIIQTLWGALVEFGLTVSTLTAAGWNDARIILAAEDSNMEEEDWLWKTFVGMWGVNRAAEAFKEGNWSPEKILGFVSSDETIGKWNVGQAVESLGKDGTSSDKILGIVMKGYEG